MPRKTYPCFSSGTSVPCETASMRRLDRISLVRWTAKHSCTPRITSMVAKSLLLRALICAALACVVASCSRLTGQNAVYVVVEPQRSEEFLKAIASFSRENGMTPHSREVLHSQGLVLHTLEASGSGVTLWLANVPLSGKEDPQLCGHHDRPYPDPSQFSFYVEPRFFWVTQEEADGVLERIVGALKPLGYDVRSEPAVCGSAALRGG